ncbi:hypothetical protein ACIRJR_24685 [Streptomyces sp. NPDC102402]|uniref:hypothetical protein n=1 Tax=Streptomyces sp. NPDC102402 TaxID=3366169 RepID=UPI0038301E00
MIQPAQPEVPQPAAPLQQLLDGAVREAYFAANVDVPEHGTALSLTVHSSDAPFDRTVEAATAWMTSTGIDGTAAYNETGFIVITMTTAAAVHQLIAVLLNPHIRARTTAAQLTHLLQTQDLMSGITTLGVRAIELTLADDDDLDTAIRFAALLGAPGIAVALVPHRPDRLFCLAERIKWLVRGAVGSAVSATADPGCAHAPDQITLRLTIEQTNALLQRQCHFSDHGAQASSIGRGPGA